VAGEQPVEQDAEGVQAKRHKASTSEPSRHRSESLHPTSPWATAADYAKTVPSGSARRVGELRQWSEGFHGWYFDEAGGLFLSDDARVAYLRALEVIATIANAGQPDDQLAEDELTRLWRAGQALRGQLSADVGAANTPRLRGSRPVTSPPASVRIVDRPATTPGG
jgi:hypothetical protein